MYNKVILIGNLTRDIEVRMTSGGTSVASFTLAVTTKWGEQEETYFADILVWGKMAENAAKYLSKGSRCMVDGRLKTESWEKEGEKKTKTRIVAENIRYLSPLKNDNAYEDPF